VKALREIIQLKRNRPFEEKRIQDPAFPRLTGKED
jgi:hypothetical protein